MPATSGSCGPATASIPTPQTRRVFRQHLRQSFGVTQCFALRKHGSILIHHAKGFKLRTFVVEEKLRDPYDWGSLQVQEIARIQTVSSAQLSRMVCSMTC
jgi:hypothetical protein